MVAPDLTIWNTSDSVQYSSYSWGVGGKNTTTTEVTFNIWNDKGGFSTSETADNVVITTKTTLNTDTGSALVEDKWFEVECTSYGDAIFTTIGGATTKTIGYDTADSTIPSDEKAIVVCRIAIPADVVGGLYEFLLRVDYEY